MMTNVRTIALLLCLALLPSDADSAQRWTCTIQVRCVRSDCDGLPVSEIVSGVGTSDRGEGAAMGIARMDALNECARIRGSLEPGSWHGEVCYQREAPDNDNGSR